MDDQTMPVWLVTETRLRQRPTAVVFVSEKQAREAFAAALVAESEGPDGLRGFRDEAGRQPDPRTSTEAHDGFGLWSLTMAEVPLVTADVDVEALLNA